MTTFRRIFQAPQEEGDVDRRLQQIIEDLDLTRPLPYSEEEIVRAVVACKPNKAVGPDGVPNEVLRCLVADAPSLAALKSWFNHVFTNVAPPEEWSEIVLKLLAKVDGPREPSQLRPIALSSHTCKVFAAAVTNRLQEELHNYNREHPVS